MSQELLALDQVDFAYPDRPVFHGVNFKLHERERIALVGSNGAGKSTLLRLMVGLHKPSSGTLSAFGNPCHSEACFRQVRAKVGLLFQDPDDQLFCPTVIEDVAFGPLNLGKSTEEAMDIANQTLNALDLNGFADRITHKLSGGEKRLISLATVLAMEPEVLLLDEPTNGLDEKIEARMIEHLDSLSQAMVFISHDRKFVEHFATRAVLLKDHHLVEAVMHSHPHVHTHAHMHIHAPGADSGHSHDKEIPDHGDHHNNPVR